MNQTNARQASLLAGLLAGGDSTAVPRRNMRDERLEAAVGKNEGFVCAPRRWGVVRTFRGLHLASHVLTATPIFRFKYLPPLSSTFLYNSTSLQIIVNDKY